MRLFNKVAIITGGASGIGAAIAELFASEGCQVVIADINDERITSFTTELEDKGFSAIGIKCDISSEEDVKRLINETVARFGKLDVLLNIAGTILPKKIEDIDVTEWDKLYQINVKSIFLTTKYASPYLKSSRGSIINMASMTGVVGQQHNAAYSSTKGAVISFTKAAAIDFAPYQVRVNSISPAGVKTPLLEAWLKLQDDPIAASEAQDRSHMLGRTATSLEIAKAALFLASDDASFITGENLVVDGGATLGYAAGPKPEWSKLSIGQ